MISFSNRNSDANIIIYIAKSSVGLRNSFNNKHFAYSKNILTQS